MKLYGLKSGDTVELTRDINLIPSGKYKYRGQDGDLLRFTVGSRITFLLSPDAGDYLRRIPSETSVVQRTTTEEFIDRYYALMGEMERHPTYAPGPISFCFIDPSLAREVN